VWVVKVGPKHSVTGRLAYSVVLIEVQSWTSPTILVVVKGREGPVSLVGVGVGGTTVFHSVPGDVCGHSGSPLTAFGDTVTPPEHIHRSRLVSRKLSGRQ
jgi:hypothetical protein